jgi:predicted kinase
VQPVLVVVGGLPGTGKSTISAALASATATPYLRVDHIEQAVVAWTSLSHPVGPVGYAVTHAIAREQLELGLDVIVECVNPIALTRDAWPGTAAAASAAVVEVEVVCSDEAEHRRRVESRESDVVGLVKPTWAQVVEREYEPWKRPTLVIDTATALPDQAVERIALAMESARMRSAAATE